MFTIFNVLYVALVLPQGVGGSVDEIFNKTGDDGYGGTGAILGDVDGDGYGDFATGAPFATANGVDWAGKVFVYSGQSGDQIREWSGNFATQYFGSSIAAIGDVNADGYSDAIVGCPMWIGFGRGSVQLISGFDGTVIFEWDEEFDYSDYGMVVSSAGDTNQDGIADVFVGAPFAPNSFGYRGIVYIYSGANGSLLHRIEGNSNDGQFGRAIAAAGDVDNDGYGDVVIGAPYAKVNNVKHVGEVFIYSGKDGALLHQFSGARSNDNFGWAVAGGIDLDADHYSDIIVGAPGWDIGSNYNVGSATVYSGFSGAMLGRIEGGPYHSLGIGLCNAGDTDGDGSQDFMVGTVGKQNVGSIAAYSGTDMRLIFETYGKYNNNGFGRWISCDGDVNNDGQLDIATGDRDNDLNNFPPGLFVYSFQPFLRTSQRVVSLTAGAVVGLSVDFPSTFAFQDYRVLASTTGTGPTTIGVEIPLTQDGVFARSWYGGYKGALDAQLHGSLDSSGNADAILRVRPGTWSGLVGRTCYMAVVVLDNVTPQLSSIAVPIQFVP